MLGTSNSYVASTLKMFSSRSYTSFSCKAYVPSGGSEGTLSHGVKTTRQCSVPRTARARNGCPANHSPRRINSTAGQAAPLAGEASDASPSP
jgi:hypothetical protein